MSKLHQRSTIYHRGPFLITLEALQTLEKCRRSFVKNYPQLHQSASNEGFERVVVSDKQSILLNVIKAYSTVCL